MAVDADQRAAALAWAAEVVAVRGDVLEELRAGRIGLAEILDRGRADEHVGRIRVLKVVEAVPGVGKVAARRLLGGLGLDEITPLAEVDAEPLLAALAATET